MLTSVKALFQDELQLSLDLDLKILEIHTSEATAVYTKNFHLHIGKSLLEMASREVAADLRKYLENPKGETRIALNSSEGLQSVGFLCRAYEEDSIIYVFLRQLAQDNSQPAHSPKQIRQRLEKLERTLAAAKMGIWEVDVETRTPLWDDQIFALHGLRRSDYNSPEEVRQALIRSMGEAYYEQTKKYHDDMVSQGKDIQNHYQINWPNGEVHFIEAYGRSIVNDEGKLQYFGVARDITAQVETINQMREHESKMIASAKMAALGEMSSGIAHEINNPLTVIQTRSFQLQQMAESGKIEIPTVLQVAESISKTTDKIARIIHSLRTFSRDGANDLFDLVHVQKVIDETLEFCENKFYSHDVKIIIPAFNPRLEIECQLVQIGQVLLNLLNNSFDAIQNQSEKWILIDVIDRNSHVEIQVIDSGPGISAEVADRMMDPFFTTKEVGHGTGLGLSISRGIIRSHKGELYYDSTSANTKFVVRLPKIQ